MGALEGWKRTPGHSNSRSKFYFPLLTAMPNFIKIGPRSSPRLFVLALLAIPLLTTNKAWCTAQVVRHLDACQKKKITDQPTAGGGTGGLTDWRTDRHTLFQSRGSRLKSLRRGFSLNFEEFSKKKLFLQGLLKSNGRSGTFTPCFVSCKNL